MFIKQDKTFLQNWISAQKISNIKHNHIPMIQNTLDPQKLVAQFSRVLMDKFSEFGLSCRQFLVKQQENNPDLVRLYSQPTLIPPSYNFPTPGAMRPMRYAMQGQRVGKRQMKRLKQYKKMLKMQKRQKRMATFDRPKRPKNVYNLFLETEGVKIKQQYPHMRASQIVKIAAERYSKLTQNQKKPLIEKYQINKRIFDRQREQYFRRHPEMDYRYQTKQRGEGRGRGRGRGRGSGNYDEDSDD